MSTPRKRHFRVADSILREPWAPEIKLTLVLLSAHLNMRWRRDGIEHEQAGNCYLSVGDLLNITSEPDLVTARNRLRLLSKVVNLSVRKRGRFTEVNWPKFPEFQEYGTRSRAPSLPRHLPPPAPAPTPAPTPSKYVSDSAAETAPLTLTPGNGKAKKASFPDRARQAWPTLRDCANAHQAKWRKTPGPVQVKTIAARLKDGYTVDDLEKAIHGAVRRMAFSDDPMAYVTATSIYLPKNIDANVESGEGGGTAQTSIDDAIQQARKRAKT